MVEQSRLSARFREQVQFLINSAYHFDLGHKCEGQRLALHLHILLVKSGDSNESLLTDVYTEKEKQIKLSSLYKSEEEKLHEHNMMIEELSRSGIMRSVSPLREFIRDSGPTLVHDGSSLRPALLGRVLKVISIQEWLDMELATTNDRQDKISRRFIIETVRNADGGAHVDGFFKGKKSHITLFYKAPN